MNEKFCKKFRMFLVRTSIDGVSFKIFHPKRHTWKNNNKIAKNGNFEPLYLGNPLWSRQSAEVGFLYGSISITIFRSHFGRMNFFFVTQCYGSDLLPPGEINFSLIFDRAIPWYLKWKMERHIHNIFWWPAPPPIVIFVMLHFHSRCVFIFEGKCIL